MVWGDWRRKRRDAGGKLCGGGSYGERYTRMCPSISFTVYAHNRPVIDGIVRKIEKVPLLNIAGGIINDYQYLWENYYFPSNSYDTFADFSCVDIEKFISAVIVEFIMPTRQLSPYPKQWILRTYLVLLTPNFSKPSWTLSITDSLLLSVEATVESPAAVASVAPWSSLVLASEASRIRHVKSYVFTASSNDERIIVSPVGFSTASMKVENSPKYLY